METTELPIDQLHEWETNKRLRAITEENYLKLKDKLTLKPQFKPLIVTPDTDNTFTVLAGNHRLKVYKELGIERVWIKTVVFTQDEQGLWVAEIDGIQTPERFHTKEDAMLDWSLVDNEEAAYYDREMFINEMDSYNLDWFNYSINMESPLTIPDMLSKFGIAEVDQEEDVDTEKEQQYSVVIECANDIEQKEHYDKLQSLGINCKMVTR